MKRTNPTWRSCFACGARSNKDEAKVSTRTYHKFPKDPTIRSEWLKFCNLNETDKVNTLFICSVHFTIDDYTSRSVNDTGIQRLKRCAIPTIKIKRRKKIKDGTVQEADIYPSTDMLVDQEDSKAFQMVLLNVPESVAESNIDPLATSSQGNFPTLDDANRNNQILVDRLNKRDKIIQYYRRENKRLQDELDRLCDLLSQLEQDRSITGDSKQLLNDYIKGKIKDENC